VRWKDWKVHFTTMESWIDGKTSKGWPKVVNLRSDPFERAIDESFMYTRWYADKLWLFVPIQERVGAFVASFREFPVRQPSASFNLDAIMQALSRASGR
jgi:arylsulfatase